MKKSLLSACGLLVGAVLGGHKFIVSQMPSQFLPSDLSSQNLNRSPMKSIEISSDPKVSEAEEGKDIDFEALETYVDKVDLLAGPAPYNKVGVN